MSILGLVIVLVSCHKEPNDGDNTCDSESPVPFNLERPKLFPALEDFSLNPMTQEGIALGKKLFYDKRLSSDNTISCASCHKPEYNFSDGGQQFSKGVGGSVGTRNSMALLNMAWNTTFFWDGRESGLEAQIHDPVVNPIEMNEKWPQVVSKLQNSSEYPDLFCKAFGTNKIDSVLVTKAIAQFLRSITSSNSRFDKWIRQEISLTESETHGFEIFNTEKGDCFHCHVPNNMLFMDNLFHNNGLDATFTDKGLSGFTGNAYDEGKFKTPTLRNIVFSAPYMHDGRFATLEEVIEHYNQGGVPSATIDPMMKHVGTGLNLTEQDKLDLLNFLKCLTDSSVFENPEYLE
ncbi:MAG: cytochrome-c peroxidase [Bacteroidia bacterium]|nr:cytochrome-c peroxidase [Bacteroidia bacterium]